MIDKRYGLYLSNNKNSTYYFSSSGNLYAINDINSDHLTDPIEWNYGGISNYKGKCYGKEAYINYEGSNLTNPLNLISTGSTTTGGMQLIFYKGYILNKTTRKFIHDGELGTIALTALLYGIYFYNNYWYIVTANSVYKSETFNASEREKIISTPSVLSGEYRYAFGVGNKLYIIGWGPEIKYIDLDSDEPEWKSIGTITANRCYNFTYYRDGVVVCTENTLYFIKESGITAVTGISYVDFRYCQLVDDFVNEQILIGTATTGNIDVIKYNGQRVAQVQSPNTIGFLFPFYREYEVNVTGEHISYEHNGVLNYNNDVESYCVNNEEDFIITINPDSEYQITNITSNYGVVDLDSGTVTYNNRESYTIDTVTVETERQAERVTSGDYKIFNEEIMEDTTETVACDVVVIYNNEYLNITSIVKTEDNIYFKNDDFEISYTEIDYVRVVEDFECMNPSIYQMFVIGERVYFAFNIDLKVTVDEHAGYEVENAVLMTNNKYFALSGFRLKATFDDGYNKLDITTDYGTISNNIVEMDNIEDDTLVNINITSKPVDDVVIDLYHTEDDNFVVNKNLTLIQTISGKLRNTTSIINPLILLELELNTLNSINYVRIREYDRYYYIDDIISISYKLYSLNLREDVLKTYSLDIVSNKFLYCTRSSTQYDVDLYDNLMPLGPTKIIEQFINDESATDSPKFVPMNINKNNIAAVIKYDSITYGDLIDDHFTRLENPLISYEGSNTSQYMTLVFENIERFKDLIKWLNDNNLQSYFISAFLFPFPLVTFRGRYAEADKIYIGLSKTYRQLNSISINGNTYSHQPYPYPYMFTIDTTVGNSFKFNIPRMTNTFADFSSSLDLYIPALGWINLNPKLVLDNDIVVSYIIDFETGNVDITLCDVTNNRIIYTSPSQCSIALDVSFDTSADNNLKRQMLQQSLTIGTVSNALASGIGIVTGNPLGVIGSIMSEGSSIANNILQQEMIYDKAYGQISGGWNAYHLDLNVRYRITYQEPLITDFDDLYKYTIYYGRPCNKYVQLESSGPGGWNYYQIVNPNEMTLTYSVNNPLKREIEEVKSLLAKGIVIH